jgi:hypothetical protein
MIYIITNYLELFRNSNPSYILFQGEVLYLIYLTHIETIILEQLLIKVCKPEYNKDNNVNFIVNSWNSHWLNTPRITNILSKSVEN